MPFGRWKPAPPPPPPPSLYERLGGAPGVLATGVRGLTGILAPGGLLGAGIAGGGEALAQGIEYLGGIDSNQNAGQRLARIATEAGIGMIPFAKLMKTGQAAKNFGRAAYVAAGGDIARQIANEGIPDSWDDIDLKRTATSALIGGTAGAVGQKVVDKFFPNAPHPVGSTKVAEKASTKVPDVVEQTARPGGTVLVPKGAYNKKTGSYSSHERTDTGPNWTVSNTSDSAYGGTRHVERGSPRPSTPAAPVKPGKAPKVSLADQFFEQLAKEAGEDSAPVAQKGVDEFQAPWEDTSSWADIPGGSRRVPIRTEPGVTPREQRSLDDAARRARQAESDAMRAKKIAEAEAEAEVARQRAEAIKASGAKRKDSLTEKATRVGETGAKETVTSRWEIPKKEEGTSLSLDDILGGGGGEAPVDVEKALYETAVSQGFSPEEAARIAKDPPKGPTGLARIFGPRGVPARTPEAPTVPQDFVDTTYEVVDDAAKAAESPMQRLLTGKVSKPRAPKKGTQIPDMGPNWPSQEDVVRQSSTYFDDELAAAEEALDAAGTNYRVAKLRGDDPEVVRGLGAELQARAVAAGAPVKRTPPIGKRFSSANQPPKAVEPVPTPPATPEDIATAPDWVREQLEEVERQANTVIPAGPGPVEAPAPAPPLSAPAPAPPPVAPQVPMSKLEQLKALLEGTSGKVRSSIEDMIGRLERGEPAVNPQPPIEPPSVPPTEPPPTPTPAPSGPKPKGPKSGPAAAKPKKTDVSSSFTLKQLLSGEGGGTLGNKGAFEQAAQTVRDQAQRELDDIEQALSRVETGSAEEAILMEKAAQAMKNLEKLGPAPAPPPALGSGGGKPRLVKGNKKGPLDITGEKGLATDLIPMMLTSGAIGGLAGAATDPEDPWDNAAIGAGLGLAAPLTPTMIGKIRPPQLGGAVKEAFGSGVEKLGELATETVEKVPNAMRANLLWGGNLPINVALAPYGAAAVGGMEQALMGNPAGSAVLRGLNPRKFLQDIWNNRDEAAELLAKGEMGRLDSDELLNPTRSLADAYYSGPAMAMVAGDVTGKGRMTGGGFTPEMAKYYALTGEPNPEKSIGGFIGHTINTIGRGATDSAGSKIGKAAVGVAQPFRRTMANVIDTGVERLPGVGPLVHMADNGIANVDWNKVRAQQAMSIPISALAGLAGAQVDPETAKTLRLRSLISNMAGVYSLPATLAFGIGTGFNEQGPSVRQLVKNVVSDALPLPSTAPFEDAIKAGISLSEGETPPVPRQMYPGIIRDARQLLGMDETVPKAPRRIPRLNRSRRRQE